MDASPPPPPPLSPPPPPPLPLADGPASTTIGKYIARFRRESPRPRDARATAQRADFWWLERNAPAASPSDGGRRSAMDWELELLSGASEAEDDALSSAKDGSPSSSRGASPWQQQASAHGRPASARSASWRSEEDVDDGLVVLESTENARLDGTAVLEASLEDPEMVIQRIRRRLGYQPPAPTSGAAKSEAILYSPVEPPPMSFARLQDVESYDDVVQQSLHVDEVGPRASRPPFSLDLSMSLEDMSLLGSGGDTPISLAVTPASFPSEDTAVSTEAPQAAEDSTLLTDSAAYDDDLDYETQEKDANGYTVCADQTEVVGDEVQKNKPDEKAAFEGDDETVANLGEGAQGLTSPVNEEQFGKAEPMADENVDSESSTSTEVTTPAEEKPKTIESDPPLEETKPSPGMVPEAHADSQARQLPTVEERRSPRLPPLSPARGPVFKPAPVTPRALDSIDPPEITAETSKTLDSLLSFVVHSWGENSFFGSDDDGGEVDVPSSEVNVDEEEKVSPVKGTPQPSPATTSTAQEAEDQPGQRHPHEELETKEEDHGAHVEDADMEAFATDPVVAMLRERIELFEEALQRLDQK